MSIAPICGITAGPKRDVNSTRVYLPASALAQLSNDGVAEARTTCAPQIDARSTAMSRALYSTPSSCLYEVSCSSSTTIKPRFWNGKNSADRAPITTCACPCPTIRQIRRRSVIVAPECHSAGFAPNRACTRCKNCSVSAISGSSTNACRPDFNAAATASRYTSVLPDPVTPRSNVVPYFSDATPLASSADADA